MDNATSITPQIGTQAHSRCTKDEMEKGDCALSPLICSQLFLSIPFKLKWSLRPGGDLSMPTEKKAKGSKGRPSYTC